MKLTEMVALVAFLPIAVIVYYIWFFIFGDLWGWIIISAIILLITLSFYFRRLYIMRICQKRNITKEEWIQEQKDLQIQLRLEEYSKLSKGEKISRSLQDYHRRIWE